MPAEPQRPARPRRGARPARLGEGARALGLRAAAARARGGRGAEARVHRLLRRRRSLRRPARRLRARAHDRRRSRACSGELKAKLVPLIPEVVRARRRGRRQLPAQAVPGRRRSALLAHALLALLPAEPNTLRLGESTHPVSTSIAIGDVRITTRYDRARPRPLHCSRRCTSSGTLYMRAASTRRSSARRSRDLQSLGLHESQSRIWENAVGRSLPFWRYFSRACRDGVPAAAARRQRGAVLPRGQQGAAVADPRRGGRAHLRPAHHPALRARAGAVLRRRSQPRDLPEAWNAADALLPRARRPRRRRTACSRTSTGPRARSATSRPTRSAT